MADREKIKLIGKGDLINTARDVLRNEPFSGLSKNDPVIGVTFMLFAVEMENALFAEDETNIFKKEN